MDSTDTDKTDPKKCDICLQDQETVKCNDCTFVSCNDCIINWYKRQGKKSCPMCKSIESYDVDHSEVVVNDKDPEDNTFAIENVNIALVMEQIAREAGMTDQEIDELVIQLLSIIDLSSMNN